MDKPEQSGPLLTADDLKRIIGWSRQHIMREEKAGRFPRRIRTGPNSVRWLQADIDRWIQGKIASPPQAKNSPAPAASS